MYEISFLPARGGHGLKILENMEMRRVFGSTREILTGGATGLAVVIKYYYK
jgi:hypothetical protein